MIEKLRENKDVIFKETTHNLTIIYQEILADSLNFFKDFYKPLIDNPGVPPDQLFPGICREVSGDIDLDNISFLVFSGLIILIRNFKYYQIDMAKPPTRAVGDSNVEAQSPFQGRDGFVESIKVNMGLVRTRIKDSSLESTIFTIGRRSKTMVSLLTLKDIQNKRVKKEIVEVINSIDIDAITNPEDIIAYFSKGKMFPSVMYVGSSDIATRRLYNGAFLLLIDRLSVAFVIPATFNQLTRLPIDSMTIPFYTHILRVLILICVFMSTVCLGVICSILTIEADFLSLRWLMIIKASQSDVVLPVFYEIFIVLSIFELLYLMGFRQSKVTLSATVVLIGGLIIGENLVSSGIAGVFIITITAIAYLSGFVVSTNPHVLSTISIIRLVFLFVGYLFGLYGIVLAGLVLLLFMYKEMSFGIHFFYPILPFDFRGLCEYLKSNSALDRKKRNRAFKTTDRRMRR